MAKLGFRSLVTGIAVALLTFVSLAHAQAPLVVTPKTVRAGTTPALTITSNGFFDLSRIAVGQIAIAPNSGVSGMRVSNASPGSVILSFDLATTATSGPRTLSLEANDVTVLLKFAVEAAPQVCSARNCRAPSTCVNGVCTAPPPPVCSPANCRLPRRCEDGVCVRPTLPPACVPRCRAPTPHCVDGVCQRFPGT